MTLRRSFASLAAVVAACLALPADAADRMRAGQWVGTTITAGRTFPNSSCISQADADAMNGDAKSIKAFLEKAIPPEICKLSDFKVNGGTVVYTATCGSAPARVVTTSYHGDSSAGGDSIGTKSEAKRTGACK
ncbi:MAG: DUF3617 family protein [Usitatibacter sp.]